MGNILKPLLTAPLNRRQFIIGVGATGAVLSLAACGVDPSSGPSNGGGGAVASGLVVAEVDFFGEQFDPIIRTNLDKLLACMFECPFLIDDSGAPAPGIVTKWEASADGAAWTLTMRDDVQFHDGTKCTSEDLAFAYQRAITEGADTAPDWTDILGAEPKIDIVDEYTITVHTQGPQPLFVPFSTHLLGIWIVPKKYVEEKGVDYFRANPIGTGPYKFVSLVAGSEINFAAVDYTHWRVQPTFDTIKARLIPNTATAIAELQGGNVDVIGVTPSQAKSLRDEGYQTLSTEQSQSYLTINGSFAPDVNGKQPLGDVRVRQALSYAINRQELIDTVMEGTAELPAPGRVGLNMPDVTPELRDKWTAWSREHFVYDVEKAKQLLTEAGYGDGFTLDFWIKQGNSSIPYQEAFGPILAAYWEKLGITVNQTVISGDLYASIGNPLTSDRAVNKILLGNTGLAKASLAENISAVYNPKGAWNGFYGNDALQKQWDDAKRKAYTSLDATEVSTALDTMLQLEADSWTMLPVLQVPSISAFSKDVDPVIPPVVFGLGDNYAYWKTK
ncbi:MAG: ABC transporter substrate-binding protein [Propionibacteriaceae bacterium]|jgi:ABC-type transport system substrate-binding protein|nr:ABC transporter substrate-binding protein [Propionibacteriaceae bacterium]